jgi:hypothetical protein
VRHYNWQAPLSDAILTGKFWIHPQAFPQSGTTSNRILFFGQRANENMSEDIQWLFLFTIASDGYEIIMRISLSR